MDQTALHPMAEAVVRKALASQSDPAGFLFRAFAEVRDLDELARRITRRPAVETAALLDLPVTVGNASLRRLSLGAEVWLQGPAAEWYGDGEGRMPIVVIAWAMAHGRDPGAILAAGDRMSASREIEAWRACLTCSARALADAVAELQAEWDDPLARWMVSRSGEAQGVSAVVAMLAVETGLPAEHWLWGATREEFFAACAAISDRADAENNAALRAAKKALSANSYEARAQWAFSRASKAFLAKWAPAPAAPAVEPAAEGAA